MPMTKVVPSVPRTHTVVRARMHEAVTHPTAAKSFDWLKGMEPGVRAELLAHSIVGCVAKDTLIQHGGEIATRVHQVVHGRVRQFILDENGNEILLHVYQDGDVLADSLGAGRSIYPLWLSSVGTVTLRSWGASCFETLKARHPVINTAVEAQTAQRFRIAIRLLTEFATLDAHGRVAGRLLHLCEFAGVREAACSQEDLAMMANVSRQTVNKVLAELGREHVVEGGYGTILVRDPARLERYRDLHRRRS